MPTVSPSRAISEARTRAPEGCSTVHGLQKLPAVVTNTTPYQWIENGPIDARIGL